MQDRFAKAPAAMTAAMTAALSDSFPVVDLRPQQPWSSRVPAQVGTGALWLGGALLLGPAKLLGVAAAASFLGPLALELDRPGRMRRAAGLQPAAALSAPAPGPSRRAVAADLGLPESQLFRARHASVCWVHHNADGRIVDLVVPAPLPTPVLSADAHPVG